MSDDTVLMSSQTVIFTVGGLSRIVHYILMFSFRTIHAVCSNRRCVQPISTETWWNQGGRVLSA